MNFPLFVKVGENLGMPLLGLALGHGDHVDMIPYDDLDSDIQGGPKSPFEAPEQPP